ncbi:unnamed protein product, partial [Polarella glacialis]
VDAKQDVELMLSGHFDGAVEIEELTPSRVAMLARDRTQKSFAEGSSDLCEEQWLAMIEQTVEDIGEGQKASIERERASQVKEQEALEEDLALRVALAEARGLVAARRRELEALRGAIASPNNGLLHLPLEAIHGELAAQPLPAVPPLVLPATPSNSRQEASSCSRQEERPERASAQQALDRYREAAAAAAGGASTGSSHFRDLGSRRADSGALPPSHYSPLSSPRFEGRGPPSHHTPMTSPRFESRGQLQSSGSRLGILTPRMRQSFSSSSVESKGARDWQTPFSAAQSSSNVCSPHFSRGSSPSCPWPLGLHAKASASTHHHTLARAGGSSGAVGSGVTGVSPSHSWVSSSTSASSAAASTQ